MSDLREYLAANMFDGDGESGVMTAPIKTHLDTIVEVVGEWLDESGVGDKLLMQRVATPSPALTREALAAALHTVLHPAIKDCRLIGNEITPRPDYWGKKQCEVQADAILAALGTPPPPPTEEERA